MHSPGWWGSCPNGLTWGAEAVSCVCKTGGQHLPALGVFDPSRGDSAGEWQDLTQVHLTAESLLLSLRDLSFPTEPERPG